MCIYPFLHTLCQLQLIPPEAEFRADSQCAMRDWMSAYLWCMLVTNKSAVESGPLALVIRRQLAHVDDK